MAFTFPPHAKEVKHDRRLIRVNSYLGSDLVRVQYLWSEVEVPLHG